MVVYSQLSRCSTARMSSTGLLPVAPAKVTAIKSILSTEDPSDVEMKNTSSFDTLSKSAMGNRLRQASGPVPIRKR